MSISRVVFLYLFYIVAIKSYCNTNINGELNPFSKVKILCDVNVICIIDNDVLPNITYSGKEDLSKIFYITNNSGTLNIQLRDEINYPNRLDTIRITANSLSMIENSYSCQLSVIGNLDIPDIKIKQYGNGMIKVENISATNIALDVIAGKGRIIVNHVNAQKISCRIIGTGKISINGGQCCSLTGSCIGTGQLELGSIPIHNASFKYLGAGTIVCQVVKILKMKGLGTTRLEYTGNPIIKRRGNIKPRKID